MKFKQIAAACALAIGLANTPAQAQALDPQTTAFLKQLWNVSTPQSVRLVAIFNQFFVYYVLSQLNASDQAYVQGFMRAATTNPPTLKPATFPPNPGTLPVVTNTYGYTQMISFGDSMSDTGGMQQVSKAVTGFTFPEANGGRFSDGPVAFEAMANRLNLPLTNYAFAGASSGQGDLIPLQGFQKGVLLQINDHLANLTAAKKTLDAKALYVIWAGPNDFYTRNLMDYSSTATQAAANISTAVTTLYNKGARHFFIPNMPDLSITPSAAYHELSEPGYKAKALARTNEFAAAFKTTIANLKKNYPSAHITTFDSLTYMRNQLPAAKAKGINTTDSCLASASPLLPPNPCTDPSKFVFWDGNHPTSVVNADLGGQFATAAVAP